MSTQGEAEAFQRGWRAAIAYCGRREHLRRTLRIALVVGVVLTGINQLDVILRGEATRRYLDQVRHELRRPVHRLEPGLLAGRRSRIPVR